MSALVLVANTEPGSFDDPTAEIGRLAGLRWRQNKYDVFESRPDTAPLVPAEERTAMSYRQALGRQARPSDLRRATHGTRRHRTANISVSSKPVVRRSPRLAVLACYTEPKPDNNADEHGEAKAAEMTDSRPGRSRQAIPDLSPTKSAQP